MRPAARLEAEDGTGRGCDERGTCGAAVGVESVPCADFEDADVDARQDGVVDAAEDFGCIKMIDGRVGGAAWRLVGAEIAAGGLEVGPEVQKGHLDAKLEAEQSRIRAIGAKVLGAAEVESHGEAGIVYEVQGEPGAGPKAIHAAVGVGLDAGGCDDRAGNPVAGNVVAVDFGECSVDFGGLAVQKWGETEGEGREDELVHSLSLDGVEGSW